MGLFSGSKKVYQGGLIRTPLMEDIPNVISEIVQRSIIDGSNISESLVAGHLNGFSKKGNAYLSYGKKYYVNKLPEGDKSYGSVNPSRVKEVLEELLNEPVTIRYLVVNDPVYIRFAAEYCQKHYGWNSSTGHLDNPPSIGSNPVVLVSAENDGTSLSMQLAHSPYITYVWVATPNTNTILSSQGSWVAITAYRYTTLVVPMAISGLAYHVEYTLDSDINPTQKVYLWNYATGSNLYPSLDDVSAIVKESQYYPIVPIRQYRTNIAKSPSSQVYITGNKLLKKIGLSMKDLTKSINESGSINDIDDAFFLFSIDMNTPTEVGKEYLYKFWKQEVDENDGLPTYLPSLVGRFRLSNTVPPEMSDIDIPTNRINIYETEFNAIIKYSGIDKYTTPNRVIGKIGTVTLKKVILPLGSIRTESSITNIINSFSTRYYERSYIILEKQISATETETIKVIGLEHESVITGVRGIRWTVTATLSSGSFFLPMNYDLVKTFTGIDESKLLMESLSMLIYWTTVTKVKTGGFLGSFLGKLILVAIIIGIAIVTGYFDPQTFLASLSAMTATEIAISIATSLAISYGLKKLGEMGGIFAVIATVAAMYYLKVGPFAQNAATLAEPSWAESLLNAVTMISDAYSHIISVDMSELMEDVNDFLVATKDKTAQLEAAQDLLDNELGNNVFDPFFIMRRSSKFNPNESPSAFYARTLNTNPGVVALDYTSNFVDISLMLPEFNGLNAVTTHNQYAYNG